MLELQRFPLVKPPFNYQWQPELLAEPHRSIAKKLAFIFPIWEGGGPVIDLVTGQGLALESGASWSQGVGGIGSTTSSTTAGHFGPATWQPISTSDGVGTGDFTILAIADPVAEARDAHLVGQHVNSGGFYQFYLAVNSIAISVAASGYVNFGTYGGIVYEVAVASRVNGLIHCWAGRRSATALAIWEDGSKLISTGFASAQDVTISTQKLRLGNRPDGASNRALKQNLYLAAGWNSALSDDEMAIVTANPWGLITPEGLWSVGVTAGVLFNAAFSSGDVAAANTWSGSVSWADPNRALGIDVAKLGIGSVTSVTYGGAACTLVGTRSTVTSFGGIEMWRITGADPGAPAAGSNTLVVNLDATIEFAVNGASYTGVHQTVPTEGFNSAQATNGAGATDASVSITSVADNTLIHAAVVASDTSITANQTTRNNVSGTLGSGADEDSGIITPAGATTMSYTGVGAFVTWAMAGFAWRPVSASGGVSAIVERKYPRGILRGVMRGSA